MEYIYQVVTKNIGSGKFESKVMDLTTLLASYALIGVLNNLRARQELQGQPVLKDLLGPMYNGKDESGKHIIRYESQEVYNSLSI